MGGGGLTAAGIDGVLAMRLSVSTHDVTATLPTSTAVNRVWVLQGLLSCALHTGIPFLLVLSTNKLLHHAGAFLSMAILFFKDAGGSEDAPHNSSMVANALQQLQANRGLRAVLMIVGLLLILYGEHL